MTIISKLWGKNTIQRFGLMIAYLVSITFGILYLYFESESEPTIEDLQQITRPAEVDISVNSVDEDNSITIMLTNLVFNPALISMEEGSEENSEEGSEKYSIEGNPEKFCIENLIVNYQSQQVVSTPFSLTDYCYERKTEALDIGYEEQPLQNRYVLAAEQTPLLLPSTIDGNFQSEKPLFFYPWDKREVSVEIFLQLNVSGLSGEKITIAPVVNLKVNQLLNWRYKAVDLDENNAFCVPNITNSTQQKNATCITISQSRKPSLILFVSLLLISIFALIYLLSTISDKGSFLEVTVGILLGLWGGQQILVPRYITGATFINQIVLALYFFLGFIVIMKLVDWLVNPKPAEIEFQCPLQGKQNICLFPEKEEESSSQPNIAVHQLVLVSVFTAGFAALITYLFYQRKNPK